MIKPKNQKGFAIMTVLLLFTALFTGFSATANLVNSNLEAGNLSLKSSQALYLGEAAAEAAKAHLRANFDTFPVTDNGTVFALGDGEYYFDVAKTGNPDQRRITAYGAVPDFVNPQSRRVVEVVVEGSQGIFKAALNAEDTVRLDTGREVVDGDVFSGDRVRCWPSGCPQVTGTATAMRDPDFEFPTIDMEPLKQLAIDQGNYFDIYVQAEIGHPEFPHDFYYTPPFGGNPGVPNVVWIDVLLVDNSYGFSLDGNTKNRITGGLLIINVECGGNKRCQPGGSDYPPSIRLNNRKGRVNGVIWSGLNNDVWLSAQRSRDRVVVDGAIMSKSILLYKYASVYYNQEYVDAIRALDEMSEVSGSLEALSWNEKDPLS